MNLERACAVLVRLFFIVYTGTTTSHSQLLQFAE